MTKEAGIGSYSQFQRVSSVEFPDGHLNNSGYEYSSNHQGYSGDPKNIPDTNDSGHKKDNYSDVGDHWHWFYADCIEYIDVYDSTKTLEYKGNFSITFQNKIDINCTSLGVPGVSPDLPKE